MTPGSTTPGSTTPGSTTPDSTTPDSTTPDSTTPDSTTPDSTTPDSTTSDRETPDRTTSDSGTSGGRAPDAMTVTMRIHRDDGPACRALGRMARGRLPPLPAAAAAGVLTGVLLVTRPDGGPAPALFAPVIVLLLTGPASTHPHDGRLDWLVPPTARGIEYGYFAVLGFAQAVSAPLVFVLIAVLALHRYGIMYRTRQGRRPQEWVLWAGLGWEGRMLFAAAAGLFGLLPFAYAALAAYLGVLFGGESLAAWARSSRGSGVMVDLKEEEA